jgi:hypothetical protein
MSMRRVLDKVVFVLCTGVLVPLTAMVARAAIQLAPDWFASLRPWLPLAAGAAGYAALYAVVLRRNPLYRFAATLDHELVHVLVGVVTGGRVHTMSVSALGHGEVGLQRVGALTAVAPYVLTLPLLAVFAVQLVAPLSWAVPLGAVTGVAAAYHAIRVVRTAHPGQPDFAFTTYPLALVWVGCGLALWAALLASALVDGYAGTWELLRVAWSEARGLLST